MNITLDQLLALEAIVRTGSFARAAAEMHRVPSAISYLVRGLESGTGLELFDRSKRQAVLTPAGRRLLAQAQGVLEGAHQRSARGRAALGLGAGAARRRRWRLAFWRDQRRP